MNASTELLEEAAQRFLQAQGSPPLPDLDDWLDARPEHRLAFAQVCVAWYAAEPVAPISRMIPIGGAIRRWMLAASLMLAVALGAVLLSPASPVREHELLTGVRVRASANADLTADSAPRTLLLGQGRVWFGIDSARSGGVEVRFDHWRVIDVGTRFAVDADRARVAVFSGAVDIVDLGTAQAASIRVNAGTAFDLVTRRALAPDGLEQGLDRGQWMFIDLTLAAAVAELERESGRRIWLHGARNRALPRMILPDRDVDGALRRICHELSLRCTDLGPLGFLMRP